MEHVCIGMHCYALSPSTLFPRKKRKSSSICYFISRSFDLQFWRTRLLLRSWFCIGKMNMQDIMYKSLNTMSPFVRGKLTVLNQLNCAFTKSLVQLRQGGHGIAFFLSGASSWQRADSSGLDTASEMSLTRLDDTLIWQQWPAYQRSGHTYIV